MLGYFATSVAASDAVVAYRSNTGSCASDALNCPKIRIWNSTSNGSWGPEVELATAGSPIRWAVAKQSTTSPKMVIVTSSDDFNLDAYVCPRTANCSAAASWVVQNNIGVLTSTSGREFDLEFETASGRAILVYSVLLSKSWCDLAYKLLSPEATSFGNEYCIDDNSSTGDRSFSWVDLDRNKTNSSNGLVAASFNVNDSDVETWVWDGSTWGSQFSIAVGASNYAGGKGFAVSYAADSSIAMVAAGDVSDGDVNALYFSGTWWTNASLLDMTSSTDDVKWLTLKADPATDDLQATAVTSTGSLSTAYWNGASWAKTVDLDSSIDSSTSMPADFAWDPSGSTGKLVWDTDTTGTTLAERSCSPQCTAGTVNISTYGGTGAWLELYTNPTAGDAVNFLSLRLPSDFTIGSLFWDGTSYSNYGDSAISTNTTVTTFGASSLSYILVASNQLFSFLVNSPANGTNFDPPVNVTINLTVNDSAGDACLRVFGSNYSLPSNESLVYETCGGLNAVPPGFNSSVFNWSAPVINNQSGLDLTELVFLYHMDKRPEYGETEGTGGVVYDFSGNGNNATLRSNNSGNLPFYEKSAGKLAGGFLFDGEISTDKGGFLIVPSAASGPLGNNTVMQNFTAMAWIKVNSLPDAGGSAVLWRGDSTGANELKIEVEQSKIITVSIDSVDYTTTKTINLDQWHHVALVRYSNGTFEFYIDGVMNRTGTETGTLSFSGAMYIGLDGDAADANFGEFFNGRLDEVALFNRTMLSTEVIDFYRLKNGTYYWYANLSNNTNTQLSSQRFFTIGSTFGYLNSSLLSPTSPSSPTQNETFSLQANVTCIGAAADTCGFVNATLRYNASLVIPNSNVQGGGAAAIPFFSAQANPQNCGTLAPNSSCNLTWTVNATGLAGNRNLLDVVFASDRLNVNPNATQNATITITAPAGGNTNIVGLNVSYNTTSVVAGSQLLLTATGFDVNGATNNSGGFNYTWANSTTSGSTYVSGNESTTGVFNFTRNGTFAFNVSAFHNRSAWNVSIAQNVTVTASTITGLNFSLNTTSAVAGDQVQITVTGFDRFGNINTSGGFNFTSNNSGVTYVSGNTTAIAVFNVTRNGTFSFNVSGFLNSSAWNSTGPNLTTTSATIVGLNFSSNATSVTAGSQVLLTSVGFDRFGNANSSGGFNFTWANSTTSGSSYVSGNETASGVFNFTLIGTFAFNVSSSLNGSAWNVSIAQNVTVTGGSIVGLNFSSNASSVTAGSQVLLTSVGFDRFGNANSSGGFNFTWANSTTSGSSYVSGNTTASGVFNFTLIGTFGFNVSSSLNGSAWNVSVAQNVSVTASSIFSLNVSLNTSAIVAGDQLLVSAVIFDRFGNLNSSGGANFSGNASGTVQVGSNGSSSTAFNLTRNGTWSFNVSVVLNSSIWNSTGDNITVTSSSIYSLNLTLNATSAVAGSQITASASMADRFGNLNFTGGANYSGNSTGITQVNTNGSSTAIFNLTRNGTFSFNATPTLNLSAPNATGDNITISSDYIAGINATANASSIVAGDQVALSALTFDRFGNLNFSGGGAFVGNSSGVTQVGVNGTITGVFNLTRNGTFAFNVSSVLNSTTWNITGPNLTVNSTNMAGINASLNSTSANVGDRVLIRAIGFDRFGNLNFTGGFNYSRNNSNVDQVGSNGTLTSTFSAGQVGSTAFNVSSIQDQAIWNSTGDNLTISLQSTPAPSSSSGSSSSSGGGATGGGGGGSNAVAAQTSALDLPSFNVSSEELNLFVVATEEVENEITVTNTGNTTINVSIKISGIANFVEVPKTLKLAVGESKNVTIRLKAPDSGIYGGRITFTSGDFKRDVLLLVNVHSANALFDVSLSIPESFQHIGVGGILKAFISLLQVGPAKEVDATLNYYVKDFDGNTLIIDSETFRVFRSKSFVKEVKTSDLAPGDYIFGIEVIYPEGVATSSSHFTIVNESTSSENIAIILLAILAIVVIAYSIINYKRTRRFSIRRKK